MGNGQIGFFDLSDRYASLDAKKDPLVEIHAVVPRDKFRTTLERVWRKPDTERKSFGVRKRMNAVLMFKTLLLSASYNLSDRSSIRCGCRSSYSLALDWLYRGALTQAGMVVALVEQFHGYLARQGYIAWGVHILDASIVPVPRNHNSRDENKAIKSGDVPEDWAGLPSAARRMSMRVGA